jgi:hypothetical protein
MRESITPSAGVRNEALQGVVHRRGRVFESAAVFVLGVRISRREGYKDD